jgi:hypothetical protein
VDAGGRDPGQAGRPDEITSLKQWPSALDDELGDTESECGEVVGCGANGRQLGHRTELLVGVRKVPKLRRGAWPVSARNTVVSSPSTCGTPVRCFKCSRRWMRLMNGPARPRSCSATAYSRASRFKPGRRHHPDRVPGRCRYRGSIASMPPMPSPCDHIHNVGKTLHANLREFAISEGVWAVPECRVRRTARSSLVLAGQRSLTGRSAAPRAGRGKGVAGRGPS